MLIRILAFPFLLAILTVWDILYWTVKGIGEMIGNFFNLILSLGEWVITGRYVP